jgi:hypothetical protein
MAVISGWGPHLVTLRGEGAAWTICSCLFCSRRSFQDSQTSGAALESALYRKQTPSEEMTTIWDSWSF